VFPDDGSAGARVAEVLEHHYAGQVANQAL
jgi:hypothetical protein